MKRFAAALALFTGLCGAILAAGGVWLVLLGGSPQYVVIGILVTVASFLFVRRRAMSILLYSVAIAALVLFNIGEAGENAVAWIPRVAGPVAWGIVLIVFSLTAYRVKHLGKLDGTVLYGSLVCYLILMGALSLGVIRSQALTIYTAGDTLEPRSQGSLFLEGSSEWLHYGNDLGAMRFSATNQITVANVHRLTRAWAVRLGTVRHAGAGLETTPVFADGILYVCNQEDVTFAIDAETGRAIWRFDPEMGPHHPFNKCRAVSYFRTRDRIAECESRILKTVQDGRLLALDAKTGRICRSFGENGVVDLRKGLPFYDPTVWAPASASLVINGLIIVGSAVRDNLNVDAPSGVVRAYDVLDGSLVWSWDAGRTSTGPMEAPFEPSTPNTWAPMTADPALNMIYLSTGNPTPDYFGGHRKKEVEKFANSIVALDASSGKTRWARQLFIMTFGIMTSLHRPHSSISILRGSVYRRSCSPPRLDNSFCSTGGMDAQYLLFMK